MRKLKITELNRISIEEFKEAEKLPLVVVLDNIRSLHNIGSVFRTSDAFRVECIYLCGITATPPHPETVSYTHLDRNGSYIVTDEPATKEELKSLHKLIKKVTGDIEQFSYNTSVSAFMICVNELFSLKCSKKEILNQLIIVLAHFAQHVCEELWDTMGHADSVCDAKWPAYNEEYLVEDTINYTISFNGKARFNMEFPADETSEAIQSTVLADERSTKWMEGKSVVKVIVVPKKIVNIVIK